MNRLINRTYLLIIYIVVCTAVSCAKIEDIPLAKDMPSQIKKMDFDILVTRDGQVLDTNAEGLRTKSDVSYDTDNMIATMDTDIPFGLIAIDYEAGRLVLDNEKISSQSGNNYAGFFDYQLWGSTENVTFSAYYPYVQKVDYGDELGIYSIPYSVKETEKGPMVSKTVERAIHDLNTVSLVFQHITNDIGFMICDVTPDEQLQGLIHLRKITINHIAQAGVFINDILSNSWAWRKQAFFRNIVVFEGDAKVGVGAAGQQYVGSSALVDSKADSFRFYAIPDEIELRKQTIEVVYDVDGFEVGGFYYTPLPDQVARFSLYGLLPDNVLQYGKQYTFHLGLDISKLYPAISFSASVGEWESHIYENNEDF